MEESQTLSFDSTSEPKRLFDFCERNAKITANSVCFIDRDSDGTLRFWTWGALFQEVLSVVGLLREYHVEPQSRVLNLTANSLEWILVELACSYNNTVHVPVDTRLPHEQVLQLMRDVKPVLVFVDDEERSRSMSHSVACLSCHQLRVAIDQSRCTSSLEASHVDSSFQEIDVANILFTSGTTSTPKGVMLSHRNLVRNAMAKLDAMPQFPTDHRLNLLPFSHAYAKTCELATWLISASTLEIIKNSSELFDRFGIAKPTLFNGVPLLFKKIYLEWLRSGGGPEVLHKLTGGRIRQFASGGAPILDELRAAFEKSGLPIFQGYGLTEAGPVVCSNRSGANSGGADQCLVGVGPAVKGAELRIGHERRLWVRGDGVMLGYWNDPESTSQRIKDGWLDTGDVAEIDESHNVRIIGRSGDTIILENGYKIDPLGIEQLICSITGIRDCALIPNDQSGYDAILLCEEDRSEPCKADIEFGLRGLLSKHLVVLPNRIVLATEDWTESNGLRNFKGTKNRTKIKQWVSENRVNL